MKGQDGKVKVKVPETQPPTDSDSSGAATQGKLVQ